MDQRNKFLYEWDMFAFIHCSKFEHLGLEWSKYPTRSFTKVEVKELQTCGVKSTQRATASSFQRLKSSTAVSCFVDCSLFKSTTCYGKEKQINFSAMCSGMEYKLDDETGPIVSKKKTF